MHSRLPTFEMNWLEPLSKDMGITVNGFPFNSKISPSFTIQGQWKEYMTHGYENFVDLETNGAINAYKMAVTVIDSI